MPWRDRDAITASPDTSIKCLITGYCIIWCLSYCFHWKQERKCTPVPESSRLTKWTIRKNKIKTCHRAVFQWDNMKSDNAKTVLTQRCSQSNSTNTMGKCWFSLTHYIRKQRWLWNHVHDVLFCATTLNCFKVLCCLYARPVRHSLVSKWLLVCEYTCVCVYLCVKLSAVGAIPAMCEGVAGHVCQLHRSDLSYWETAGSSYQWAS